MSYKNQSNILLCVLVLACATKNLEAVGPGNDSIHGGKIVAIPVKSENSAVKNFREYLRIDTAHPTQEPGYVKAIEWLRNQAKDIGLDFSLVGFGEHGVPHSFALWMTWNGTDPEEKSVLINSHVDVVPVDLEKWTYPPFEAFKDGQGNIFGRGANDMKAATVAELEAIRLLKNSGFKPLRNIHLMVTPDEEIGDTLGVKAFLESPEFENLNIGVDIDEGFPIDSEDTIHVTYAEKADWKVNITVFGDSAHGSTMPEITAAQRLQVVIDKMNDFRKSEYSKMKNGSIEEITSTNLVLIGGGLAKNIIPNALWVYYDVRIRILPGWNYTDVVDMVNTIAKEAMLGNSTDMVKVEFETEVLSNTYTVINDSNIWWTELQKSCKEMNMTCEPHVLTAATDGRLFRNLNIPTFGFCPFPNTKNTAHQNDESINEANFLIGIDRYANLIKTFAMVPGERKPTIPPSSAPISTGSHKSKSTSSSTTSTIELSLKFLVSIICIWNFMP